MRSPRPRQRGLRKFSSECEVKCTKNTANGVSYNMAHNSIWGKGKGEGDSPGCLRTRDPLGQILWLKISIHRQQTVDGMSMALAIRSWVIEVFGSTEAIFMSLEGPIFLILSLYQSCLTNAFSNYRSFLCLGFRSGPSSMIRQEVMKPGTIFVVVIFLRTLAMTYLFPFVRVIW